MVSKTIIVAFVALCCAQAFAAPREEQVALGGYFSCIKDVTKAMSVVKDFTGIVSEYKKIFADGKTAKAACAASKTADEAADEAAIKQCQQKANQDEINALISETKQVGEKVVADWPKVQKVIKDCFDL